MIWIYVVTGIKYSLDKLSKSLYRTVEFIILRFVKSWKKESAKKITKDIKMKIMKEFNKDGEQIYRAWG